MNSKSRTTCNVPYMKAQLTTKNLLCQLLPKKRCFFLSLLDFYLYGEQVARMTQANCDSGPAERNADPTSPRDGCLMRLFIFQDALKGTATVSGWRAP